MLGDINKLFVFKSLLTKPSNVLPLHLKQTFLPRICFFTEGEGNGIKSRLPFKIFSTLLIDSYWTRFNQNKALCITRQRQQDQPPHCITGVSTDLLFSVHPSAEVTLYTPRGNELDQHQQPKSLYISHAVSNFYGTENEIWAGFGPVGSTEKKIRQIMSNS